MATLIKRIRCSYPNWCHECGVLRVPLDVEKIVVDSSNCSKFYDNDFPRMIIGPKRIKTGGRRCCGGTLAVYSNTTVTESIISEKEPPVGGNTTELSTTESSTLGIPTKHLPTFSDFTPYLLVGAGGFFFVFILTILVSVFVKKKRLFTRKLRCRYTLNATRDTDMLHSREKALCEVDQAERAAHISNSAAFQPSFETSAEEADCMEEAVYLNEPDYLNINNFFHSHPRRCRGSPILPPQWQES